MTGRLIGIAGKKGHGKDTVAQLLVEQGYELLRFADPLKSMLRAYYKTNGLDAVTIEQKIEGALKELPCSLLRGKSPRVAMQTLGTEWGRGCIAGDVWVRSLIARYVGKGTDVVVPDVRFENECDAIHDAGGTIVLVDAGTRVPDNLHSNHESELNISNLPADIVVNNVGTVFELREAVRIALR